MNVNRIKVGDNYINLVIPLVYKDFEELKKILMDRVLLLESLETMED